MINLFFYFLFFIFPLFFFKHGVNNNQFFNYYASSLKFHHRGKHDQN